MPKRILQGVVVSDKQDKTVIVRVERIVAFCRRREVPVPHGDRIDRERHKTTKRHHNGEQFPHCFHPFPQRCMHYRQKETCSSTESWDMGCLLVFHPTENLSWHQKNF